MHGLYSTDEGTKGAELGALGDTFPREITRLFPTLQLVSEALLSQSH